jgi:hypothetical protein
MSLDLDTGGTPSDIGGGAASMVMSFASGSIKHVETTSVNYASLAHFIYGGSNEIGAIINFNVNCWVTQSGTADVRLVDLSTGNVVATLSAVSSNSEDNVQSMGAISNLPTVASVIEIQARRATGNQASRFRIASLELQYE